MPSMAGKNYPPSIADAPKTSNISFETKPNLESLSFDIPFEARKLFPTKAVQKRAAITAVMSQAADGLLGHDGYWARRLYVISIILNSLPSGSDANISKTRLLSSR